MTRWDARPERHALLELDALLGAFQKLREQGDGRRYACDERYRWLLHRLWIAAGNEAYAYAAAIGRALRFAPPWADLYDLRNHLAHHRLSDVDEGWSSG